VIIDQEVDMRRYDDPVEVRRGRVDRVEGPEQFVWHGKLWKVSSVQAHWVETGPWWRSSGVHAVLGGEAEQPESTEPPVSVADDLLAEREVWRVEAAGPGPVANPGVFDLVFDWAEGSWRLVGCVD